MKKYTFNFTNENNNRVNNTSNGSMANKTIDAIILGNIKRKMPYLVGTIDSDYAPTVNIITPKVKHYPSKSNIVSFVDAIRTLDEYAAKKKNRIDFYLSDGKPVTFFGDEVQIGYKLYDLSGLVANKYNISDTYKRDIVNIFININI